MPEDQSAALSFALATPVSTNAANDCIYVVRGKGMVRRWNLHQLLVTSVSGEQDSKSAIIGHNAGQNGWYLCNGRCRSQQFATGGKSGYRLQVLHRGIYEVQLAPLVPGQGLLGPDPCGCDSLVIIVNRLLSIREGSNEEPGVEALRCQLGSHPMAEVMNLVNGKTYPLLGTYVQKCALAGIQFDAQYCKPRSGIRIPWVQVTITRRQQHASLFETFAHRRNPVREATAGDPQQVAGLQVRPSDASVLGLRAPIRRVDLPSREDVCTPYEIRFGIPTEHADFQGCNTLLAWRIAHEHDGGCVARDNRKWTGRLLRHFPRLEAPSPNPSCLLENYIPVRAVIPVEMSPTAAACADLACCLAAIMSSMTPASARARNAMSEKSSGCDSNQLW